MVKIPYFFKSKRRILKSYNENFNFNNNISKASSITSDFTRLDEIKKFSHISAAPSSFSPSSKKSFLGKTKNILDETKNRVSSCFSSKNSESKSKTRSSRTSQYSFFNKLLRDLRISHRKSKKDHYIEQIYGVLNKLQPIVEFFNHSENIDLLKTLVDKLLEEKNEIEIIRAELEEFKNELGTLVKDALKEYFQTSTINENKIPTKQTTAQPCSLKDYNKEENKLVLSTKISDRIDIFNNLIKQNQTNIGKLGHACSKTNLIRPNKFNNDLEFVALKRNLNEIIEKKQLSFLIDEDTKSSNSKRPSRLLATKDSLIMLKDGKSKLLNDKKSILSGVFSNELQERLSLSSCSINSKQMDNKIKKSKSSNDIGLKKVSFQLDKNNNFLSAKEFECICKSKYLNSENVDKFLDFLTNKMAMIREKESIPDEVELMSKRDKEIEKACLESIMNQLKGIAENIECLALNKNFLDLKKRLSLINTVTIEEPNGGNNQI
jgi:hypothetical protein